MPRNLRGKTIKPVVMAARDLRKRETEAEQLLWTALRGRRLNGIHFRRQHPVEHFVLDFFCVEHQLGIELDGKIHEELDQREYDMERTSFLEEHGIQILRFKNEEVCNDLPRVLRKISDKISSR